jgi:Tfp pilus assembly protein PilF
MMSEQPVQAPTSRAGSAGMPIIRRQRWAAIAALALMVLVASPAGPAEPPATERATYLLSWGKSDSALAVVRSALRADSADADLWVALAAIYETRGQATRRLEALRQAVRCAPHSVAAHAGLADAFLRRKALDSAAVHSYAALGCSLRQSPDAYFLVGRVHEEQGHLDSAITYYHWAWNFLPIEGLH